MNKRTTRTLKSVYDGICVLLSSKDYEDIKVDEILAAAHISRATFYSHFKCKDDVLSSLCDQMFDHVFSINPKKEGDHDFSSAPLDTRNVLLHLTIHFYDDKTVIKPILTSSSRAIFTSRFISRTSSIMNDCVINHILFKEGVPVKIQSMQLTDSFVSLICHWIEMNCMVPPETIIDYFFKLHQ